MLDGMLEGLANAPSPLRRPSSPDAASPSIQPPAMTPMLSLQAAQQTGACISGPSTGEAATVQTATLKPPAEDQVVMTTSSMPYSGVPDEAFKEDNASLVRCYKSGIEHRDALLQQEREIHRDKISAITKRLIEAEEREAALHGDLLLSKEDTVALGAAQRRIAELTRDAETTTAKLSTLSDAESLNQQKHVLLSDTLDAQRRKSFALSLELDALRAEMNRIRGEQQAQKELSQRKQYELATRRLMYRDKAWALLEWKGFMAKRGALKDVKDLMAKFVYNFRNTEKIAFKLWAQRTRQAMRLSKERLNQENLRRERSRREEMDADVAVELKAVLASAHAQELALQDSLETIRTMGMEHREETALLGAEIASLTESLNAKRESVERLRRANSRIIAQFEMAEAEFLEADRRQKDIAAGSVVNRVIEAVFGHEAPDHPEHVQALLETGGRGDPLDRLVMLGSPERRTKPVKGPRGSRGSSRVPGSRHIRSLPFDALEKADRLGAMQALGMASEQMVGRSSPRQGRKGRGNGPPRTPAAANELVERAKDRAQREFARRTRQ